jgi:branched-chain amino acid transport system permease protein
VVGFAGQLAIGWVAMLTLGAYTTSVLALGQCAAAGAGVRRLRRGGPRGRVPSG